MIVRAQLEEHEEWVRIRNYAANLQVNTTLEYRRPFDDHPEAWFKAVIASLRVGEQGKPVLVLEPWSGQA